MATDQVKRLKRRILDYLFKYASEDKVVQVAKILGIKEN